MPRSAHLIGIGGAGMRSLAKALHARGVAVSGTDLSSMEKLADLSRLGMRVHDSHASEFLGDPEVVVYSTAIPTSNPEFAEAKSRGIRIMHRAEMLAEFLREHRSILIAGTHGKTTTTTLTALLMEAGGLDPWAFVGGEVKEFEGNVRCGGMEWCVAEADESDGSFLLLPGQHGIITNIESEHLSYWKVTRIFLKDFSNSPGDSSRRNSSSARTMKGFARYWRRVESTPRPTAQLARGVISNMAKLISPVPDRNFSCSTAGFR